MLNIEKNMAKANRITIQELLSGGYNFIVKPYQRGYRWEKKQIVYLIRDLATFDEGTKYCLQPIIVAPTTNENEYELVDGQQRLTTIWIMKELYASFTSAFEYSDAKDNFSILYENKYPLQSVMKKFHEYLSTDEKGVEKLAVSSKNEVYQLLATDLEVDAIGNRKSFTENEHADIDYFIESIKTICSFKAMAMVSGVPQVQSIFYFLKNIFQPQGSHKRADNAEIIWYELNPQIKTEDPILVFTNVNVNKIKLTNSELVKAKLMYEINTTSIDDERKNILTREKISLEWEDIERKLNDDSFWYFIHGEKGKYVTRMDFLLEVYLADEPVKKDEDEYAFYDLIDKKIIGAGDADNIWREMRQIFYTFVDWYHRDSNCNKFGDLLGSGELDERGEDDE